jgi:RHS repeat-associated protein
MTRKTGRQPPKTYGKDVAMTSVYTYDLDNRLIRETYADGNGLSFGYDLAGLMNIRTNARGIVTTYTYDANHNLLTTSYSDGTPGVTNTYDAFNRLTLVKDGVGTNAYVYDANSRLISCDGPWADDTITYAYDALGRQTNLVVQGGTAPLGYAYDPLNRLTGISVGADVYTYAYSNANPIVQRLDRPNGSYTTYAYDSLNRLTGLSNRKSTQEIINQFLYAYNAQDLRFSETISNGLAYACTTNDMVRCDYNNLNQLLTSAPPSRIFAYDADGNLTRGCTPGGDVFNATYDAENRLKTLIVTNGEAVVSQREYLYAWNSFLAQETLQGTNQIRHLRTGYLPLQERNSGNSVTRELAWGLDMGGGIGGLLELRQTGQNYSYLYDGKGNVVTVLDNAQTVVAAYAYDDFGSPLAKLGTFEQPMRFSTQPYDETTGLVRYSYRFYAPSLGRWLNRDPIGESGGLNLYAFVGNNPVNFIDPFGLDTYELNRMLGDSGMPVLSGNSGELVSHTLFYTTDGNGNVEHTYSWNPSGNATVMDGNKGIWEIDNGVDLEAARINQGLNNPWGIHLGGPDYDERLKEEIERRRAAGEDVHFWWLWNNCKTEAGNAKGSLGK